jgi:hypothetical protein
LVQFEQALKLMPNKMLSVKGKEAAVAQLKNTSLASL